MVSQIYTFLCLLFDHWVFLTSSFTLSLKTWLRLVCKKMLAGKPLWIESFPSWRGAPCDCSTPWILRLLSTDKWRIWSIQLSSAPVGSIITIGLLLQINAGFWINTFWFAECLIIRSVLYWSNFSTSPTICFNSRILANKLTNLFFLDNFN